MTFLTCETLYHVHLLPYFSRINHYFHQVCSKQHRCCPLPTIQSLILQCILLCMSFMDDANKMWSNRFKIILHTINIWNIAQAMYLHAYIIWYNLTVWNVSQTSHAKDSSYQHQYWIIRMSLVSCCMYRSIHKLSITQISTSHTIGFLSLEFRTYHIIHK